MSKSEFRRLDHQLSYFAKLKQLGQMGFTWGITKSKEENHYNVYFEDAMEHFTYPEAAIQWLWDRSFDKYPEKFTCE